MFSLRDERKHYEERPSMIPTIRNDNPSFQTRAGLSDDRLRSLAPSVFAGSPLPGVSERYAFVPTAQIVSRLRESGWIPVTAFEQRVRLDERRGFQKHMLRFQRADVIPARGEFTAELVLVNSHEPQQRLSASCGLVPVCMRQRNDCCGHDV